MAGATTGTPAATWMVKSATAAGVAGAGAGTTRPSSRLAAVRRRWWPPLEFAAACLLILALLGLASGGGGRIPFADLLGGDRESRPTVPGYRPATPAMPAMPAAGSRAEAGRDPIELWRTRVQPLGGATPVVAGGLVVASVATPTGKAEIVALDATTGERRWAYTYGAFQRDEVSLWLDALVVADDSVYLGSSVGALIALDLATGDERWATAIAMERIPVITVVAETVYATGWRRTLVNGAAAEESSLFAFDATTGAQRWQAALPGNDVSALLVVGTDVVVAVDWSTTDGGPRPIATFLTGFAVRTGEQRWRMELGPAPITGIATDGNLLFVGSSDHVRAFTTDLTERWFFDLPNISTAPVVAGEHVVVASEAGAIVAIDRADGAERWRREYPDQTVRQPVAAAATLYFLVGTDQRASLATVDAATGAERWRVEVAGTPMSSPVVADEVVYVVTEGALTALGDPEATTPAA